MLAKHAFQELKHYRKGTAHTEGGFTWAKQIVSHKEVFRDTIPLFHVRTESKVKLLDSDTNLDKTDILQYKIWIQISKTIIKRSFVSALTEATIRQLFHASFINLHNSSLTDFDTLKSWDLLKKKKKRKKQLIL